MKPLMLIFFMLLLAACASNNQTLTKVMSSWVGHSEAEVVTQFGAPDETYETASGLKILTWHTRVGWGGGKRTCKTTFTIDKTGKVINWNYSGC